MNIFQKIMKNNLTSKNLYIRYFKSSLTEQHNKQYFTSIKNLAQRFCVICNIFKSNISSLIRLLVVVQLGFIWPNKFSKKFLTLM